VNLDICLVVPADTQAQELYNFVRQSISDVRPDDTFDSLSFLDIYQRQDDTAHKQITFHYSIASYVKTMTDTEATALLNHAAEEAKKEFGAERI
jgi:phenylalanyl-tRNA synthetase beta subunit